MNSRKLSGILMRMAAVLLALVLFSTALVSGRYARYTSSASGSDSAKVAKFLIEEEGGIFGSEVFTCDLAPGETEKASITVKNKSEVAVNYTLSAATTYQLLPLQYTVTYDGQTNPAPFTCALAPGQTAALTLNIIWPEDAVDAAYSGKVDTVELTLQAVQID